MTDDELRTAAEELRRRSRAAQGLADETRDPVILRNVARFLLDEVLRPAREDR